MNTICLFLFVFTSALLAQSKISTINIVEKAGITSSQYPVTFGFPFSKGLVNKSKEGIVFQIAGTNIPTQVDFKTSWDDGSVKFAILTGIIPQLNGGSAITLDIIKTATVMNSTGFISEDNIRKIPGDEIVSLTMVPGKEAFVNVDASLKKCTEGKFEYWLKGPLVTEILCSQKLNASMSARWQARYYPTTSVGARISVAIENTYLEFLGAVNYNVTIKAGVGTLTPIYSKPAITQNYASRWRKVLWLAGNEPSEIQIKFDIGYLIQTGLVVPFARGVSPSEALLQTSYAAWLKSDHDILGSGTVTKYFPTTGGREEVGIYPGWTVKYLLSMDNRAKAIMLGNAEMAGTASAHFRESNAALRSYDRVVSLNDRPDIDLNEFWKSGITFGGPNFIGLKTTGDWEVDQAHQGSFAYIPYLVTGDYYYLDEMLFWASYDLARESYGRAGSKGILFDQFRGVAWGLRNIAHAASLMPDSFPEKPIYFEKVTNNINELNRLNIGDSANALHMVIIPSMHDANANTIGIKYDIAPWQQDFIIVVLSDIIRHGFNSAGPVRDSLAQFTIGRFSNDVDFPKFYGAGYWWPEIKIPHYKKGDWKLFWSDVKAYEGKPANFIPTQKDLSDNSTYGIYARAVLSFVQHLPKARESYDFLSTNLNVAQTFSQDPTWALTRGGDDLINIAGIRKPKKKTSVENNLVVFPKEFSKQWYKYLKFTGMPEGSHLFIISPKGNIVFDKTLSAGESLLYWNGNDNKNIPLPNSEYIFYVRDHKNAVLDSGTFNMVP